jgi:hypothetical protein
VRIPIRDSVGSWVTVSFSVFRVFSNVIFSETKLSKKNWLKDEKRKGHSVSLNQEFRENISRNFSFGLMFYFLFFYDHLNFFCIASPFGK